MLRRPVALEPAATAGSVTVMWETGEPYQVLRSHNAWSALASLADAIKAALAGCA